MAWMADTYINFAESSSKISARGVVTGKPLRFVVLPGAKSNRPRFGLCSRDDALGMGLDIGDLRFSLIGYGNVGSWAARLLQSLGATLQNVMDHTGAIYNADGIDAEKLAKHVAETGGVAGMRMLKRLIETLIHLR